MQCQSAVCWNSARRSWRNHDYSYSYHSTLTFQFGNTDSMNVPVNLRIISNVGYITPSLRLTISPSDAYTVHTERDKGLFEMSGTTAVCVCVTSDALPPSRAYTRQSACKRTSVPVPYHCDPCHCVSSLCDPEIMPLFPNIIASKYSI